MDIFNKKQVSRLESDLDRAHELIRSLESDVKELADLRLRVKCMKMYIEDDEAILELMELSKKKARDSYIGDIQRQYAGLIGRQYQGTAGLSLLQQAGFAQDRSVLGSWQ